MNYIGVFEGGLWLNGSSFNWGLGLLTGGHESELFDLSF